jgi:heme-degrading monooxygenase HmoA
MYTLIIEGTFQPGKKSEFVNHWNKEILPGLKKQQGFVDEVLLFGSQDPNLGVGLSFWKTKEDAERYHREVFPKLAEAVQHLMNGTPTVRSFKVEAAETFQIRAGKAA